MQEFITTWWPVVPSVIAVASAVAKITPNEIDDKIVHWLLKAVDFFALTTTSCISTSTNRSEFPIQTAVPPVFVTAIVVITLGVIPTASIPTSTPLPPVFSNIDFTGSVSRKLIGSAPNCRAISNFLSL